MILPFYFKISPEEFENNPPAEYSVGSAMYLLLGYTSDRDVVYKLIRIPKRRNLVKVIQRCCLDADQPNPVGTNLFADQNNLRLCPDQEVC